MKLFFKRSKCPGCNHKNCKELINLEWDNKILKNLFLYRDYPTNYIKEKSYTILECRKCSLIYQKYSPTEQFRDLIYNEWIGKRNLAKININDNSFNPFNYKKTIYHAQEIARIINLLPTNPTDCKVFDFGMGWGGWCLMAKLMGLETYGVEITNSQIQYNKAHGENILSWDEIPNYAFDFINSEQVFEHLDKPFHILQHLLEGLKIGGLIKISVPDSRNIKSNLAKNFESDWFWAKGKSHSLNPIEPLQHLNGFNYKSLLIMTSRLGLKEVTWPKNRIGVYTYKNFLKYASTPLLNKIRRKTTYLLFRKV